MLPVGLASNTEQEVAHVDDRSVAVIPHPDASLFAANLIPLKWIKTLIATMLQLSL